MTRTRRAARSSLVRSSGKEPERRSGPARSTWGDGHRAERSTGTAGTIKSMATGRLVVVSSEARAGSLAQCRSGEANT